MIVARFGFGGGPVDRWRSSGGGPALGPGAAGRCTGASDTAWRQTRLSEAGAAAGQVAATLLRGFYKYYETLFIEQVLDRCFKLGFPMLVARLAW
eukprot:7006719-Pyramimonas_sp.AAC.1